jgi:hypothetical protein
MVSNLTAKPREILIALGIFIAIVAMTQVGWAAHAYLTRQTYAQYFRDVLADGTIERHIQEIDINDFAHLPQWPAAQETMRGVRQAAWARCVRGNIKDLLRGRDSFLALPVNPTSTPPSEHHILRCRPAKDMAGPLRWCRHYCGTRF